MRSIVIRFLILFLILSDLALLFLVFYLQPRAVVVPHHDMVADTRLKMLKLIKNKRLITNTVIILSPDHFSGDQKSMYFSDRNWDFPSGTQYYDKTIGGLITEDIKKNNNLVANDHGIFNVASDVNIVWPKAKIVPILIGQNMTFDQMSDLISKIETSCKQDCLLITSVDFSHYLPYKLANVHDQNSIRTLVNMDLTNTKQIEVDSPQSIFVLINFAKYQKANYFKLYAHTNSAQLIGAEDAESTSHVFGWYQRNIGVKNKKYEVKTFTYAKNISKKENLNSLGERFFYGIDDLNLNDAEIPKDVVVAGVETPGKIEMVYLPLRCKGRVCEFARGEERVKMLQNILKGADNKNGEITITKN